MSLDPILWAMKDAPTSDINEWGTLVCLAEAADEDGCNAFPSVKTIAAYAKISTRTVQRALAAMEERRLIAEGDQRAASYIPEHRRPVVYDLLIPHSYFRDIERTNAFRVRLGRRALTPEERPDIAPAPPKKSRADKGQPKPKKPAQAAGPGDEQQGRLVVTPVGNPAPEGGRLAVTPVETGSEGATASQGVTSSREGGDFKSPEGRLEVTQTSPSTRPSNPPRPSVGSSEAPDGGTDGHSDDIRTQKKAARAIARTPGVDLLLGIGGQRPELLLTGRVLEDQGRMVDGLLLSDWPRDLILTSLLRPLPENTRSVGAVISRRLSDLARTPVPRPLAMPAPRGPEDASWGRDGDHRDDGWDPDRMTPGEDAHDLVLRRARFADCVECRDPIVTPTGTARCVKCERWERCPVCRAFVQPGAACESCEVRPAHVRFEECSEHGDRFVAGTACFQCAAP
ncbi:helix-turn-helix domain-containing protein [Streptomyces sp. NPDC056362]|uniref:helix-turn-helix domain-containing protein n=1 Tax=unclassified Streptomyces TaxID=2593676 RepID=UPI0035D62A21